MRMMYCWRCKSEVAMLDEEEFAAIEFLHARAVRCIKERCRKQPFHSNESYEAFKSQQFSPMLEECQRITGQEHATEPAHLLHHRISKCGPDCSRCGKPLRTPRAKHCAACGADKAS